MTPIKTPLLAAGCSLYVYCENNPVINTDSSGNFSFKNLWNKVSNGVKKVGNYILQKFNNAKRKFSDFVNNAKNKFVIEASYGVGAEINVNGIGAVISSTANATYKNNKVVQSTSSKVEGSLLDYKLGIFGKHEDDGMHDNYFVFFDKKQNECENSDIGFTIGREVKNLNFETTDYNSKFIGLNLEGYLGAGGYIKIGFELD